MEERVTVKEDARPTPHHPLDLTSLDHRVQCLPVRQTKDFHCLLDGDEHRELAFVRDLRLGLGAGLSLEGVVGRHCCPRRQHPNPHITRTKGLCASQRNVRSALNWDMRPDLSIRVAASPDPCPEPMRAPVIPRRCQLLFRGFFVIVLQTNVILVVSPKLLHRIDHARLPSPGADEIPGAEARLFPGLAGREVGSCSEGPSPDLHQSTRFERRPSGLAWVVGFTPILRAARSEIQSSPRRIIQVMNDLGYAP